MIPELPAASSTEIDLNLGQSGFRVFVHGAEMGSSPVSNRAGFELVGLADLPRLRLEDPHGLLPHLHFSIETFKPWWDAGFRHHYLLASTSETPIELPIGLRALPLVTLGEFTSGMTTWQLLDRLAALAGVVGECEAAIESSN